MIVAPIAVELHSTFKVEHLSEFNSPGKTIVRHGYTISCLVLLSVSASWFGCAYEPERIPFEPFVSQEQIGKQIKDVEIQLQSDPNDQQLLVQYAMLLSKRFQYKITHVRDDSKWAETFYTNEYRDFYVIDSIVERCFAENIVDKTLIENHIRNNLLFTGGGPKNLDRIKHLSDWLLLIDSESRLATIGLAYFYLRVSDRANFSLQVSKIRQWNHISDGGTYLAREKAGYSRSILVSYMFKDGMSSRDDFFLSRGLWPSSRSHTPTLKSFFYPGIELAAEFRRDLADLKPISFPFWLSIAPFIGVQLAAYSDAERFFEKYCLHSLAQMAEEDSPSKNEILGEIIRTYASLGAYEKAVDWIQKIPAPDNPKVLRFPKMHVGEEFVDYAMKQAHLSVGHKLLLSSWRVYDFDLFMQNQNDLRNWIRRADSLRESVGKKGLWISPYEIDVLSEICAKENHKDQELVKRTWQSIMTYLRETGNWTWSKFLMGLTFNGKNTKMRNYLEEIMNESPRNKELLHVSLSKGLLFDIWDVHLLITMRKMKLLDRRLESLARFYTIWLNIDWGNIRKSITYLEHNEGVLTDMDEYKKAHYYETLLHFCSLTSQWQGALRVADKLIELESVNLPRAVVDKGYCLFKLGRKKESDSIFAIIENNTPHYDYQYMVRAKILVEMNRKAEAEQLINEKVRDPEDRKAFWGSISKQ